MKNLFRLTLLLIVVGFASCKKEEGIAIDPLKPGSVPLLPTSASQFHASIDGVPFALTLGHRYIDTTGQSGSFSSDTIFRVYHSVIFDTVTDEPAAWMYLGTNPFKTAIGHLLPTPAEFNLFFKSGYRPFVDTAITHFKGAAFFWRDTTTDVLWTTLGPQPGAVFRVDTIAPLTIMGQHHVKARMSFNCTLYDGNGAIRNLTNGVFIGIFRNG